MRVSDHRGNPCRQVREENADPPTLLARQLWSPGSQPAKSLNVKNPGVSVAVKQVRKRAHSISRPNVEKKSLEKLRQLDGKTAMADAPQSPGPIGPGPVATLQPAQLERQMQAIMRGQGPKIYANAVGLGAT